MYMYIYIHMNGLPPPAAATAGPRVSDSTHSFDDRSDRSGTRRWEKRSYPQPQEAEPAADDPEESPLKKLNLAYAAMIKLQVQNLGATNTSKMLRLRIFTAPTGSEYPGAISH